ncbi:DNA mismatch endonuclease Vsr [Conexibacter woesei]|uniref:very short patch repair endonuclease n=1 Tax=Conexibacter woesei TaxID=191495 RepID=UPI0009DC43BA
MQRVRRRDTGPELRLRSALHRLGLRYRVDAKVPELPRHRIDVLFRRARVAVFVDGCFWHLCPEHGSVPKANAGWWTRKLAGVRARDARTDAILTQAGWEVVRVWEHEEPDVAAARIAAVVTDRLGTQPRRCSGRSSSAVRENEESPANAGLS